MTQNPVLRGRELFKQEALDAIARADTQYGEQQPELNALYLALNALVYATLALGEPEGVAAATFGEPDPLRPVLATIGEPERIGQRGEPLYRVEWLDDGSTGQRTLLFRNADGGILKRWFLTGAELDADGLVLDETSLAAWVAEGVLDDFARSRGWSKELTDSAREQAATILSGEV